MRNCLVTGCIFLYKGKKMLSTEGNRDKSTETIPKAQQTYPKEVVT